MSTNYTKPQLEQLAYNAAVKHGVDPDILHSLITKESTWNPKALSSAGAQGIAQFMPATAKGMGVNPWDPASAIDGAARYLANALQQTNGSYKLAVASYNSGMPNVKKYGGVPPFAETQNYVKKIMAFTDARKAQQDGQNLQEVGSNPIPPQQLDAGHQETFPESEIGGEEQGKKQSFKPLTMEEVFPEEAKKNTTLTQDQKALPTQPTSPAKPGFGLSPTSPATDFMHLRDHLEATYPGGLTAFMAMPVKERQPILDEYNKTYLAQNAYFQSQPVKDKIQYLQDQKADLLSPTPFLQQAGQEIGGFFQGTGQSLIGQAGTPQNTGEQIGQFVGPLAGGLGAAALGSLAGPAGTLAALGAYGGIHGTAQGLKSGEQLPQALGQGAIEAGTNLLSPLIGPEASILERTGINLGIGGVGGGAEEAVRQSQDSKGIDLGQIAQSAGQGALSQAVLGEALHQAPQLAGKASDFLGRALPIRTPKQTTSQPIEQPFSNKPEFTPGTPEYEQNINDWATNPQRLAVSKKVDASRTTQLAKQAAFDPSVIEQPLDTSSQFHNDVVQRAADLEKQATTKAEWEKKSIANEQIALKQQAREQAQKEKEAQQVKVTYRPLSDDDIDNHVTKLLGDWQQNNAGDLAANLSEIRKGAKTDQSYRDVLNQFAQEKARITKEGKAGKGENILTDKEGNVYQKGEGGELTSVTPSEESTLPERSEAPAEDKELTKTIKPNWPYNERADFSNPQVQRNIEDHALQYLRQQGMSGEQESPLTSAEQESIKNPKIEAKSSTYGKRNPSHLIEARLSSGRLIGRLEVNDMGEITHLVVKPQGQKQGIGSKLLDKAESLGIDITNAPQRTLAYTKLVNKRTLELPSSEMYDNSLPQEQGAHTTLSQLLEDPQNMEHFQSLPLQTQQNMLSVEQAAIQGQRGHIFAYDPISGLHTSGERGLFTLPDEDKSLSPVGFEMGPNGIKVRGYNNNGMERSYLFKTGDDTPGIGGFVVDPHSQPFMGRLANAYHPQGGRYIPDSAHIDKALTSLTDQQITALKQPSNTMAHGDAKTQLGNLFNGDMDKANMVYHTLTDANELYNHMMERTGLNVQDALKGPEWNVQAQIKVANALRQDPMLQKLANLLGC